MRRTVMILCTLSAVGALAGGCADSPTATPPAQKSIGGAAARDVGPASFTSLAFPGATFTLPLDVNDHGVIVGRYAAAGRTHGFVRDAGGVYTTLDFPGSNFSVAASINDSGAVAGWYTVPAAPAIRHGFVLKDGAFTTVDPPGSTFTNITGINERGDVSGRYCTLAVCRAPGSGSFHGFVYGARGFTTLDVPGGAETDAFKLAPNGDVVGGSTPTGGPEQLFVFSHDQFTAFGLPNGKNVSLDNGGTNSHGDIVGTYCDSGFPCLLGPTGTHGFLLTSGGALTTIDYPGAAASSATGINARGDVVGGWTDAGAVGRGFVLRRRGAMP